MGKGGGTTKSEGWGEDGWEEEYRRRCLWIGSTGVKVYGAVCGATTSIDFRADFKRISRAEPTSFHLSDGQHMSWTRLEEGLRLRQDVYVCPDLWPTGSTHTFELVDSAG